MKSGKVIFISICTMASASLLPAQTFSVLHAFNNSDGSAAYGLIQGSGTNLYGVTQDGGSQGQGTVFQLATSDMTNFTFSSLYSFFNESPGYDGENPVAGLVEDRGNPGTFYGTTEDGGQTLAGSVYQLTPFSVPSNLHFFDGTDGFKPVAPLIQGADGNFYGTTFGSYGATNGTIFMITSGGVLINLHVFSPTNGIANTNSDGAIPLSALVEDQAQPGTFYGAAARGGAFGSGTVFQLKVAGSNATFTTLHSFKPTTTEGSGPRALVQGLDGNIYGVTAGGAANAGTLFIMKVSSGSATITSFSLFPGGEHDDPNALILGKDGNFYGTTLDDYYGIHYGAVFQVKFSGATAAVRTIFAFDGTNGASPSGLMQAIDGNFYGTTLGGGPGDTNGEVFQITWPAPFIAAQPIGQTNYTGSKVTLSVSAGGAVPLAYQWFKGSGKLANSARVSGAYSNTLTLVNLATSDAGLYHVVVTNLSGSAISANAVLSVLIPDKTRPTLAIVTPKVGLLVSNELFTAAGTAKDNVTVAGVYWQLNGGDWAAVSTTNHWTNWTAGVSLVAGTNVLSAYAVDTSTNFSATNTVRFFYAVNAPFILDIVGQGTVNPDYNGKLLSVGKGYTMTAKAAPGFGFLNWRGGNAFYETVTFTNGQGQGVSSNYTVLSWGDILTNRTRLSFVMAPLVPVNTNNAFLQIWSSAAAFQASFVDVKRPVCIIKYPAVNQAVTNTLFALTGRAGDNVGVDSVWVRLNDSPWLAAATTNSWTNWTSPYFIANSGPNVAQAFAVDAAGNASLTNSVKFSFKILPVTDWAPDSLNGLLAWLQPSTDSPFAVALDPGNFTQTGVGTNVGDYGVGTYIYTKLATNQAELSLTNYGPPPQTNVTSVALTFTNHYSGVFSNEDGSTGFLKVAVATNFLPVTLARRTVITVDNVNTNVSTLRLLDATRFTQSSTLNGSGNGTYSFVRFSPVGGLLLLNFTDGSFVEVEVAFNSAKTGVYFAAFFNAHGPPPGLSTGTFTLH